MTPLRSLAGRRFVFYGDRPTPRSPPYCKGLSMFLRVLASFQNYNPAVGVDQVLSLFLSLWVRTKTLVHSFVGGIIILIIIIIFSLSSPCYPILSYPRSIDNQNHPARQLTLVSIDANRTPLDMHIFLLVALCLSFIFAAAASPSAAVRRPRARTPFHGPRAPGGRHRRVRGGSRVRRRLHHGLSRPAGTAHAAATGGSPGAG